MSGGTGSSWTAAAGEISGLLSSVGNWIVGSQESRKSRKHEKKMAQYAFNKNLEMWNLENQYNAPINQVQRLIDAGLNPALMYQQGNTGNAGSGPQMSAPGGDYFTGNHDLNIDFQSIKRAGLENDRMEKMNELLDQQIDAQFWDTMRKNFEFGIDFGEPGEVNLVKSRSGRDYSYASPNWQGKGGTLGPAKFYDLNAKEAELSSAWWKNDYNKEAAIRMRDTNTLFQWEKRTAEAEARIKEATAQWVEQRWTDWNTKGYYADKLASIEWFEAQIMDMSKKGALTIGGLQKALDMLKIGIPLIK